MQYCNHPLNPFLWLNEDTAVVMAEKEKADALRLSVPIIFPEAAYAFNHFQYPLKTP